MTELLEGWDPETHPEVVEMVRDLAKAAAGRRRQTAGRRPGGRHGVTAFRFLGDP